MKKSKLIVPAALAVMLLSTAASVTGTVAWFTANRSVDITADNFEVVSTDGSLDYSIAAGNCTTVTQVNGKDKVSVTSGKRLTDASVDLSTAGAMTVYTDNARDDGEQPTAFSTVASTYVVPSTSDTVYYCATWTITFTYEFSGGPTSVDLLFNCGGSVMTAGEQTKAAAHESTMQAAKGFRIGMYTSAKAIVFADLEALAKCSYITATSGTTGTYTAVTASGGNLVDSTNTLALAEDGVAHSSRGDFIGTITKGSGTTGSLTLNCVAWFEGTDENIINDAEFKKMSATLKFYTRRGA